MRGNSMLPSLLPGDRLVVVRRRVRVGDVVAVRDPRAHDRVMVKRVAAVGAEGLEVLGDNPAESTDSRQFGPIRADRVVGVAVYRYFPTDRAGRVERGPVRSTEWTTPASTPSSPPGTWTG